MLTYSFLHRSNPHDKVYFDDLWLLRLFSEGAPQRYACAPYVLADHMQKHNERKLLCGHFVTRIFERLGVDDTPRPAGIVGPRSDAYYREARWMSRLLTLDGNHLIPDPDDEESSEGEEEDPEGEDQEMEHDAAPPTPSAYDFSSWGAQLEALTNAQLSNAEYNRQTQESLRRIEESQHSHDRVLQETRSYLGRFEEQKRYFGSQLDRMSHT